MHAVLCSPLSKPIAVPDVPETLALLEGVVHGFEKPQFPELPPLTRLLVLQDDWPHCQLRRNLFPEPIVMD